MLLALLATGAPGVPNAAAAPPQPRASWSPCGDGFECALVNVPLDHSGGAGGAIQLSLMRLPATDDDARIGSLFVNPGGPGGSGVDFVRAAAALFPPEIRARYDLVGFDPRGVGRSTPVRCFGAVHQAIETLPQVPFPTTPAEVELRQQQDDALAGACDQRARRIIDHMSTADVARDLDVLREAVGDERLHYLGVSYGSFLGTTYANLFPDRVGRIVIDGVLDPVAWSTGRPGQQDLPFSTRLRSHEGAQDTLEEFFRLCDEAAADPATPLPCAFGPGSSERFEAVAAALREDPVELAMPDGSSMTYTYAHLVSETLSVLYEPFVWPPFTGFLALLEVAAQDGPVPPSALGARYAALDLVNKRGQPAYPNVVEAAPGVACADSDNPTDYDAWPAAAAAADADSYFGSPWTWLSSFCAAWPGEAPNRYTGPWGAQTAAPVLVVGNRFDPATPYHGAALVHDLLPDAKLLTYEGPGHVALGRTPCVDETITGYLLGDMPADETVCPAAPSPFDVPLPPAPPGEAPPPPGDGVSLPGAAGFTNAPGAPAR